MSFEGERSVVLFLHSVVSEREQNIFVKRVFQRRILMLSSVKIKKKHFINVWTW
jgi:hypothetical protein